MDTIWNEIYKIFITRNYTDIELRQIIRQWDQILGRPADVEWNREKLRLNAVNRIRMLKVQEDQKDVTVLLRCLCALLCPDKFSVDDLNRLLEKYHISYRYDESIRDGIFIKTETRKGWDNMKKDKFDKIFISHATKDGKYVKAFVEFLEDMGLGREDIFCTSIAGYGVPLNGDIYETIKQQFTQHNIYVIFLLSENYYNSPACLNEMGAAWVLQKDYTSVLVPGFEYKKIEGAVDAGRIGLNWMKMRKI